MLCWRGLWIHDLGVVCGLHARNISDGAVSDNVSAHSRHSVQEAMKGEQVHFGMDAMEALGRSAAGLRESEQPLNAKERHT